MSLLSHYPDVAGVDEAGRGPLAGPVAVGAVILTEDFPIEGLNDSKKLSPIQRQSWEEKIKENCVCWSLVFVEPPEIDSLNILGATLVGMARALEALCPAPARALIDGNQLPKVLPCPAEVIVEGDAKVTCIAAASILAKTARDSLMIELAKIYPEYGFERHYGYPTPEHLAALRRYGPCPIHRMSFEPVRQAAGLIPETQLCLTFEA